MVYHSNRDAKIELLRFFATMSIAIFHFEWIYIGHPVYFRHFYLFVEFFFVLSGFFLAKNLLIESEMKEINCISQIWCQGINLWKPYIIGFIFSFIAYCIVHQIKDLGSVANVLWMAKWEVFYLHLSGFESNAPTINGVTGYIPALLFANLIISYMFKKHYHFLVNIFIPIVPIFIYSHILNFYGNLSQWVPYENFYTVGMLRGVAGVALGVGAYIYGEKIMLKLCEGGGKIYYNCMYNSNICISV